MATEEKRSGPPEGYEPGSPPRDVRGPADKHFITRVRVESRADGKAIITMIEPWVDTRADMDAINHGEGFYHAETGRAWINGRLYGTHLDHRRGTVFPISGSGFFTISTLQHYVLRKYIEHGGPTPEAEREIARVRGATEEDMIVARRLWTLREKGGGS